MEFKTVSSFESLECDTLVVACSQTEDGLRLHSPSLSTERRAEVVDLLPLLGFSGKVDEVCVTEATGRLKVRTLTVVGLGKESLSDNQAVRRAAGRACRVSSAKTLAFDWPLRSASAWAALTEGAGLGSYRFNQYKSDSTEGPQTIYLPSGPEVDSGLERSAALLEGSNLLMDLVNTPALDLYPESFKDRTEKAVADLPVEVTVWDAQRLHEEGCGGIAGVGQGSSRPPFMVRLDYNPSAKRHVAMIGKGITFDSGGISLKPGAKMEDMKSDMTGAATVLGATIAAARLGLDVHVTTYLALAENLPGGSAQRPSDVVKIRNGKTVEIINTDAEGRLVMADALSLASELEPDQIIDIATLTGAQIVALGNRTAGIMGQGGVPELVFEASKKAGENMWVMPLPEELEEANSSKIADVKNSGGRPAGMLVAGNFLSNFVGDFPWAHIDIAGPSFNTGSPWGYSGYGATAMGMRTLVSFLEG